MHHDLGIDADPESSGAYLTDRTAELFRTSLVWKPARASCSSPCTTRGYRRRS